MTTCGTSHLGFYGYVNIFIDQTEGKGGYTDACSYKVTVEKRDNQPSKGYKKYVHTTPGNRYYLAAIKCVTAVLKGFPKNIRDYNTNVFVFFLEYDAFNIMPLVVGLTKDGKDYEYYRQTDYKKILNEWEKDLKIDSKGTDLKETLDDINKTLGDIVVIKLDATKGTYYVNGRSEDPPEINKNPVSVTSKYRNPYRKYEHRLKGGTPLRPLSTVHKTTNIQISNVYAYNTPYDAVYVYYWSLDDDHNHPLILEFKSGESSLYQKLDKSGNKQDDTGGKWINDTLDRNGLVGALDKLNCSYNGAHRVDLSSRAPYTCQSCIIGKGQEITVDEEEVEAAGIKYGKCKHYLKDGPNKLSVTSFTNLYVIPQTGLPSVKNVDFVHVYKYPEASGIPIMVQIPCKGSNKWYRKTNDNEWTEITFDITNKPTGESDKKGISEAIKNINTPFLVIEADKSAGQEYYGASNEKVRVESDEGWKESDYKKLLHVRDGGYFRLNNIKSGDHTFKISCADPLSLLSIFYVKSKGGGSVPILIELEKENKTYKYYSKANVESMNWTEYTPPAGQVENGSNKMTREALKDKLDEFKEKNKHVEPEKEIQVDTDESEHLEEALPSTNTTMIVGIAVGVCLACALGCFGLLRLRRSSTNLSFGPLAFLPKCKLFGRNRMDSV